MLPASDPQPVPGFVALLRFRADDGAVLMRRLRQCVAMLSAFDGFIDARVARAIDDASLIVMELGWRAVGDYRRALSSYEVKVQVVPLLSEAIDEPTAYEVLHLRDDEGIADALGALAADAGRVSLGSAAAAYVPPAPS